MIQYDYCWCIKIFAKKVLPKKEAIESFNEILLALIGSKQNRIHLLEICFS